MLASRLTGKTDASELKFQMPSLLFELQVVKKLLTIYKEPNYTPPKLCLGGYIGVGLSVGPSIRLSVHLSVCSFLSALFLINYWTNFIQTSQVNSVSSRDVHVKCWLWFIDFSLSYGPFMKFLVRSFSHQLLDRFGSNYTNRLGIKQRCAYPILVMVYFGFMELWPFDDSGQISFKLHG